MSGAYFLALRDSNSHTLSLIGQSTGVIVGEPLTPSTGGGLIPIFTANTSAVTTGATGLTGLAATQVLLRHSPGYPLVAYTGTALSLTGGPSVYHAPFRGAN